VKIVVRTWSLASLSLLNFSFELVATAIDGGLATAIDGGQVVINEFTPLLVGKAYISPFLMVNCLALIARGIG
jgi:hypothetical protein